MEVVECTAAAKFFETGALLGAEREFALQLFALAGDFAGLLFGLEHIECVAGLWSAVKAEDEYGDCGTGLLDALVTLVEHGLHLAVVSSGEHDIAYAECAVLHEHRSHIAASLVET